jgi:hypothetical protein
MTAGKRIVEFIEKIWKTVYNENISFVNFLDSTEKLSKDDILYIMDRHNNQRVSCDNEIKNKIIGG